MNDTNISLCKLINQLHGIKTVCHKSDLNKSLQRKFDRIDQSLIELGLYTHDPLNEEYDFTRLDCDASISGDKEENLKIVEVIKPLIYSKENGSNVILQKALVIVEGS